jgi:hypothetical protein
MLFVKLNENKLNEPFLKVGESGYDTGSPRFCKPRPLHGSHQKATGIKIISVKVKSQEKNRVIPVLILLIRF